MNPRFTITDGLAGLILLSYIAANSTEFTDLIERLEEALTGRCLNCGYRLDHPLIRHGEKACLVHGSV